MPLGGHTGGRAECTLHKYRREHCNIPHTSFPAAGDTAARPVRNKGLSRMIASPAMRVLKRKDRSAGALPARWPSAEGWLPVAREAVQTAHAAQCAAMALKGKSLYEDAARFLARRADMLLQLLESLITESR